MNSQKEMTQDLESVVIRFAGDSGDGMQTIGERFTDNSAIAGNDISTFPDFPAEIRAPQGTLPGVSGFQIHFGSTVIRTPGDAPDVLIAMNPAALKVNIDDLSEKGLLILNTDAFTKNNLQKAGYMEDPLESKKLEEKFKVIKIPINEMTKEALKDSELKPADKMKCKNFFALGFSYWVYNMSLDFTTKWINAKWGKKPIVANANITVLKAGYYFGETTEISLTRYKVYEAPVEKGVYRKITGNEATVLGLLAISEQANKQVVLGSYPITPASAILEGLASHKNFNVKTIQAEDEISGIGVAIGASFAGSIGVTCTSGPGFCLKSEALGLAVMTELPLVVINVQRGGPSTGLPTKTEQSDLLQVLYGRNGESPVAVVASDSPSNCFYTVLEAARIALKYNTPVVMLSDGYIANGSEPWNIPKVDDLPILTSNIANSTDNGEYIPYKRNPETLARKIAIPGTPGKEHRIGGLEKNEEGMVSYLPEVHDTMTRLRLEKINRIANDLPALNVIGKKVGKVLVVGWGGTSGAIRSATELCQKEGISVSCVIIRYLNPLPKDLEDLMNGFDNVLIPEKNMGQLSKVIRAKYLIKTTDYNKVNGRPFTVTELEIKIKSLIGE